MARRPDAGKRAAWRKRLKRFSRSGLTVNAVDLSGHAFRVGFGETSGASGLLCGLNREAKTAMIQP